MRAKRLRRMVFTGLFAMLLALVTPGSVAQADDVLWVDLDFYGASSAPGGVVNFADGSQATPDGIPVADFGETQLRQLTKQVDDYYNNSTGGLIRFRFGTWHPFATTGSLTCPSHADTPLTEFPVTTVPRITVEVYAAHCPERGQRAGLGHLGRGHTWLYDVSAPVLAHEVGHNLGMMHAGSQECDLQPIGTCPSSSSVVEYGVDRDIMGAVRTEDGGNTATGATYNLTRTRLLDPANLTHLGALSAQRSIVMSTPPSQPTSVRINVYGSGTDDVLTLASGLQKVHLAYQADAALSDHTAPGVEVYRQGGTGAMRNGPAPLEVGETYGGDLGYAVKVVHMASEYVDVEVSAAGAALTAPTDVSASVDSGRVRLAWTPPASRTVVGVLVERRRPSGGDYEQLGADKVVGWSATSASVTSVGRYVYRLRLKTTQGFTPFSANSNEVSTADLPGPVTSAEIRPVNAGAVVRPQCVDGGAAIDSYTVRYTLDPSQPATSWETGTITDLESGTLSGLENGKEYSLQVACTNEVGTGDFSQTYTVTPSAPPAPPVIAAYDVEADPANPGYVRMWVLLRAAAGSEANSARMKFWLDDDWRECVRYRGDSSPCLVSKLTPGSSHVAHLVAIDDALAWGPEGSQTIRAIDPPNAPRNVRAQQGQGTALISWDASTAYQAAQIMYEVRSSGGDLLCSTATTQCSIALPANGSWTISITAFNDGVPSPATEFQGFVATTSPPPNPPVSPPPSQPPAPTPTATSTPAPSPTRTGSNPSPTPSNSPGGDSDRTPSSGGTASDIVRSQSVTLPPIRARAGTRWKAPTRTNQGQPVLWQAKPRAVCRVVKGKKLRFLKRGRCRVLVTAPASSSLLGYRKQLAIRVKRPR